MREACHKKQNCCYIEKNTSDVHKGHKDALAKFRLHPDHLKIPAHPANKKDASERTSVTVESSASEVELIKGQGVSRKCKKHPQKEVVKWSQTEVKVPSASNPSPKASRDIPGDGNGDPPGANKNAEDFQHQNAQVAKTVQESQKAHCTQDLETVFTNIVHEEGQSYQICWVCK